MADLLALARAISTSSSRIRAYAIEQATRYVGAEADIAQHDHDINIMAADIADLQERVAALEAPPTPALSWETFAAAIPEPAFTPARHITCNSRAALDLAIRDMQAGDDITVIPLLTGPLQLVDRPYARITFQPGFTVNATGEHEDTLWVARSRLILRGGHFTATGAHGRGIVLHDSPVDHRGFHVKDCAFTGVFSSAITSDVYGQVLVGRIENSGYDATYDPHAEKGTGCHGAYVGATATDPPTLAHRGCTWAFDVNVQPLGAAVSAGGWVKDSTFIVRAKDLRFAAQQQVAGNGLQLWGTHRRNTVRWLEVTDAQGRALEPAGLWGVPTADGILVEHGRATNTNQNPLLDRDPYPSHQAIRYQDCT